METREFAQDEWHDVVSQFDDLNIMQLWEYAEAKRQLQGWKIARHIFRDGDTIVGASQAMIKTIPFLKKGIVWINRGPLWQRRGQNIDRNILKEMLKILKRYWVDQEGMYLRIAPSLIDSEENVALMKEIGFCQIPNSQWISTKIDLTQSEARLRMNLEKKWRNCLKKAETLGVSYRIENTKEFLDVVTRDYELFLASKDFFTRITPEFVACLYDLLPKERTLWIINAQKSTELLGNILFASYGRTVEYLVGVINEVGKSMNAGQYLFWNALLEMKKHGFEVFDLGGAHPCKTPSGIFHFKEGMRGIQYTLVGEFDWARGLVSRLLRLIIKYRNQ